MRHAREINDISRINLVDESTVAVRIVNSLAKYPNAVYTKLPILLNYAPCSIYHTCRSSRKRDTNCRSVIGRAGAADLAPRGCTT